MNVAEEILKEYLGHEYGFWQVAKIHDAMEAYANQFKTEWISVEDRLPTPGTWCIVWLGGLIKSKPSTALYEHFDDVGFIFNHSYRSVITHWQPLPSSPTK